MKLNKNELLCVVGGASLLNGTLLGNLYKIGSKIYELGQAWGSAFRRARGGKICPI